MFSGVVFVMLCVDGFDFSFVDLYFGVVGLWCEFYECVKWYWYLGVFFLCFLYKVGIDVMNDGLVRNDENVFVVF